MSDLSRASIQQGLATTWLGREVYREALTDSTNDLARSLARSGAVEGTLVIADEQSAGRGRLGRQWWAPPGSSLLLSVVLRPPLAVRQTVWLTMIAGLACAEAVESCTGLRPSLKWPNDVLLRGRKLAGILTELETAADHLVFAVVGMGINVNVDFRHEAAPAQLRDSAVGLSQALGRPVDRLSLLHELSMRLEQRYEAILSGRSPQAEWSERLITLGKRVRVTTSSGGAHEDRGGELDGWAVGVDANGSLLLRLPDGRVQPILAGDVTLCGS